MPDYASAHYNLSFTLSQLGDFDGALRDTKRALELEPYYIPQKFQLSIDLQYEDPLISIVPEISADVTGADIGDAFVFDPALLDGIFDDLAPAATAAPAPPAAEEAALALAGDYISKGLLDLASAELTRAVARGASRARVAVLLGDIFGKRGLHGEALERYHEARTADPGGRERAARRGAFAPRAQPGRRRDRLRRGARPTGADRRRGAGGLRARPPCDRRSRARPRRPPGGAIARTGAGGPPAAAGRRLPSPRRARGGARRLPGRAPDRQRAGAGLARARHARGGAAQLDRGAAGLPARARPPADLLRGRACAGAPAPPGGQRRRGHPAARRPARRGPVGSRGADAARRTPAR